MFSLIYTRAFYSNEGFRVIIESLESNGADYEIAIRAEVIIVFVR